MSIESKFIVNRIGETDQLYLSNNTPDLALERADLRMQLVHVSRHRQEQLHFLQEAIVLLEQARMEYDEMPMQLYLNLSLHLAKAYILYFELNKEKRFALIAEQILKPLAHHEHSEIYFYLAYSAAAQQQFAMTRHWLGKYFSCTESEIERLHQHAIFQSIHTESWYKALIQRKIH